MLSHPSPPPNRSESPNIWPSVTHICVTGNNCGVFKVCVSSVRHLEDLIDRLSAYELPTTSTVLATPWTRHVVDNEQERDAEVKRESPAK